MTPRRTPGSAARATRRPTLPTSACAAAAASALLTAGMAHAANWDLQPGVSLATTYTDNVTLAAEDEESDLVTEVAPAVRLSGEGRRARLDLEYRVTGFFHREDPDRDSTFHEAAGDGTVELVRERLFLDADVARSEQLSTADNTLPSSGIFATGARGDVTTYGVTPRLQYAFGSTARLQASHRREWTERDDGRVADEDTVRDRTSVSLASGPAFNRVGWRLGYSREVEETGDAGPTDDDRIFESAQAELNVAAGARTQLFVVGGTEDNEFESTGGDAIDGDFWEAGARWSPTRNARLEAAVGERFFGDTARLALDARGPALTLRADYQETLVTSSTLVTERTTQLLRDPQGNIVLGPGGQPVTVVVPVPTIADEVILERRASGSIGWDGGYSAVTLSVLATDREFQRAEAEEQTEGADLTLTWTKLSRTTVTLGGGYTRQEFAASDREDELRSVRITVSRDFGNELDGSLELARDERTSTEEASEYEAARVRLAVEKRF